MRLLGHFELLRLLPKDPFLWGFKFWAILSLRVLVAVQNLGFWRWRCRLAGFWGSRGTERIAGLHKPGYKLQLPPLHYSRCIYCYLTCNPTYRVPWSLDTPQTHQSKSDDQPGRCAYPESPSTLKRTLSTYYWGPQTPAWSYKKGPGI